MVGPKTPEKLRKELASLYATVRTAAKEVEINPDAYDAFSIASIKWRGAAAQLRNQGVCPTRALNGQIASNCSPVRCTAKVPDL